MPIEKPILFSTMMVQAILAGRKTMTRRIIKHPYISRLNSFGLIPIHAKYRWMVDDILWVKETFQKIEGNRYIYKADPIIWGGKWKPSIFMPKDACRIKLRVINIRIERLHDISENDAISEGINDYTDGANSIKIFFNLWERINGKGSSELNPWVWVIEFERM